MGLASGLGLEGLGFGFRVIGFKVQGLERRTRGEERQTVRSSHKTHKRKPCKYKITKHCHPVPASKPFLTTFTSTGPAAKLGLRCNCRHSVCRGIRGFKRFFGVEVEGRKL